MSPYPGYFTFQGATCYGRSAGAAPVSLGSSLPDVSRFIARRDARVILPFDLTEVVTNLRQERYQRAPRGRLARLTATGLTQRAYYGVRPLLPVGIRKHLQRVRLRGWHTIRFPAWPVDVTVDSLMRIAMRQLLADGGMDRIPFVWFWPDGAESCVLMTHDIEGPAGQEFCSQLLDLDDWFGITSSVQVVPESAATGSAQFVDALRARGVEVNIHDLTHDGSLFDDRDRFEKRAAQINRHARALGARGFRAGAMYREQDWLASLDVSYDMSVPSVAHLEPQQGGCCTVMPYFIGDLLELPLTTTQDYSLFHILNQYSTELWERQIALIRAHNGLISFIAHPDYLVEKKARGVYVDLLKILARLRTDGIVWTAQAAQVDRWWRNRRQMSLVRWRGGWSIEGTDSDRARVAYAVLEDDRLVFDVQRAKPQ